MNFTEIRNMSEKDMERELNQVISDIKPLDEAALNEARARQGELAKPPGSLGTLEEISIKLAGITGKVKNNIDKSVIVICSSDNGVVEEGVTPTPQSVTMAQTINFTKRKTGVGALADGFGIDLCVIDVGVAAYLPKELLSDTMEDFAQNKIIDRKIQFGTKNLAIMPAMTRREALVAIMSGIEAVKAAKDLNYDLIGTGEMGIGNTTTSACVLTAITKESVDKTVGRGGGLNDEGFARKKAIVKEKGLDTEYTDILDILSKVGGLDICAMVGVFLGAAIYRMPVIIDGYISSVAALAASKLAPITKDFMLTSHVSAEAGYKVAMDALVMAGILDLGMRLGEGSGCPLAIEIIKGATYAMNNMATFDEGKIDENYLELMADAKF